MKKRLVLLLFVIGAVPHLAAQSLVTKPGAWSPAANQLSAGRQDGQITLLADGRVAVSGGSSAVIDLFDPATNTFTPGPADSKARKKFTATRLLDGRILFAGGENYDRSCSLYDPVAATVVPTGPLLTGRQQHAATLLPDGRVLVTGGQVFFGGIHGPAESCEIYDPARGTWSAAGPLLFPRYGHTATLLADGTVLIYGATELPEWPGAERYTPAAMTAVGIPGYAGRRGHTAAVAPDGRLFFIGGYFYGGYSTYDPATNAMQVYSALAAIMQAPAAGLLADGRIFVAERHAQTLDPAAPDVGVVTAAPPAGRSAPLGLALPDGRFLLLGGSDGSRSADLYDPRARGGTRGDFDGDGRADILWHHPDSGRHVLWHMDGLTASSITLAPSSPDPGLSWRLELAADVDGGGVMDTLWRNTAGTPETRYAFGSTVNPSVASQQLGSYLGLDWSYVAAADFTGDGREDVAMRRQDGLVTLSPFTTILPDGTFSFGGGLRASMGDLDFIIAAADDFDGDGNADVFWRHRTRGENYIWFIESTQHYTSWVDRAGHTAPVYDMNYSIAGTGDFDGNGKADVVWRSVDGPTRIWFMNGVTIVSDVAVPAPGLGWTVGVIGDFDADGKSDIFWRNPTTGENAVSLFDGWNVKASSSLPSVTETGWITPNP